MSQPPSSYPVPSGYPPGQAPLPTKPRPSGWWFVVGSVLIVGAVAAAVGLFIWTLSAFLDTDARVAADGQPHQVTVGTDGDRMLWFEEGSAQTCQIVDRASGDVVVLDRVSATYERSDTDGDWHGFARFDPGTGNLEVTCAPAGTVLIGAAPKIGNFVVGILATIFVPLFLGLFGLAILIVTGILFATRPPGSRPADNQLPRGCVREE
jgi:hypothetical protein